MQKYHRRALFLFTHDLRLDDHPALRRVNEVGSQVMFLYASGSQRSSFEVCGLKSCGAIRQRFMWECLIDLDRQLSAHGQKLVIDSRSPEDAIQDYVKRYDISLVVRSRATSYRDNEYWENLKNTLPHVEFQEFDSRTLFDAKDIHRAFHPLKQFTPFRKIAERIELPSPERPVDLLMTSFINESSVEYQERLLQSSRPRLTDFAGGELAANTHARKYFDSESPSAYKETRNELDGWKNSTKFSSWLAHGCISPRRLLQYLKSYEEKYGANDSTYWIYFELLWREFFYWLALDYGKDLFTFKGKHNKTLHTSFYPERFKQWCEGTSPWPLVNAIMHQLNQTGYISNRSRQIAASALVNELGLDWRYGAAYFQQQLIDYDEAINWGNWQYIAGVGCDPRGGRHFNIEKQQQIYDPDEKFIQTWGGRKQMLPIDSVDYVDWPIDMPVKEGGSH